MVAKRPYQAGKTDDQPITVKKGTVSTNFRPQAVQGCQVTAIPEDDQRCVLESARNLGIKVVTFDKRGLLFSVVIHHAGRYYHQFFKAHAVDDLRFYPATDGTIGWDHKNQTDLFEDNNHGN